MKAEKRRKTKKKKDKQTHITMAACAYIHTYWQI